MCAAPRKISHRPKLKFGLTWLVLIPVIVTYYIPVAGGTLNRIETLMTAPVILLLVALSLVSHLFAHL